MDWQRLLNKLEDYLTPKRLRTMFQARSSVRLGGVVTENGTISASVLQIDMTALDCVLDGNVKLQLAAQDDKDLFTTAASVGQAIFADGATAAGIALDTDETAYVTVIACDSDGAGGASGDNGAVLLVAVVAGAADSYENQAAFLTDEEIRKALLLSTSVHAGTGGFVRLADILWDEASGVPEVTITVNRDA